MNKKTLAIFIALLVILVGIIIWPSNKNKNTSVDIPIVGVANPMNGTYVIGGEQYTLVNGKVEKEIVPGSASKNIVRVFGDMTVADLSKDGVNDAVMFLEQTTGGSGTFYYVVESINKDGKYFGTNAMFLGDRIAPQNINIQDGQAVVNFAERRAGEPFTTQPSVGKSIWLHLDVQKMEISEGVKENEVISNIKPETLVTAKELEKKMWVWQETTYNNDTKVTPKKTAAFIAVFGKDNTIAFRTDCNAISGTYSLNGNKITLSKLASTMMYCEGSQEADFMKGINEVSSVMFNKSGELIMELKYDSGAMRFK
jgi:heat shock protein HslJ